MIEVSHQEVMKLTYQHEALRVEAERAQAAVGVHWRDNVLCLTPRIRALIQDAEKKQRIAEEFSKTLPFF